MDFDELQEASAKLAEICQDTEDWIDKEEQRELRTKRLREKREKEEWKRNRDNPPVISQQHRDVRPLYYARYEQGRNGSPLDRRG